MPSDRRRICQTCGNHEATVGPISWRGNCERCGLERQRQAAIELHEKRGPMYRRWRQNIIAGIERQPLDEPTLTP